MAERTEAEWVKRIDELADSARRAVAARDDEIRAWYGTKTAGYLKISKAAKLSATAIKRIVGRG